MRWPCSRTITLIPANGAPGVVSAEGRLTTCSWDIGGPAPEGFWIVSRRPADCSTRLVFVPAGVLLVLAAARWRERPGCWSRWASSCLAAFSIAIEATQLALARIDRACDVTDVIDNVTGAAIGVGIGIVLALVLRPWRTRDVARVRCMSTPQPRANVAEIPPYVAGQAADGPTRDDVVQALLQREPLPAAARRHRGRAGRRRAR